LDILRILGLAGDGHWQFGGGGLDLDGVGDNLDIAGGELGIDRPAFAPDDLAGDRDDRFDAQPVEDGQRLRPGAGDDLGQAVVVAKIDEQHPAMVALAVDPAREAHGGADVRGAQGSASVGAIGVHDVTFLRTTAGKECAALRLRTGALSRRPTPAMARPT
jgi:hypothetical protein